MAQAPRRVGKYTAAVAEIVRDAAERLNLTHAAIAERTGIARPTITKILTGDRAMDVEQLALLANAIDMSVADLLAAAEKRLLRG
ncbi:helix-turn-helix domain-containing protein [Rhodococcus sp. SGAir0479]|uniref:helix-turn-helix domain-containing protein n=1 Tax=Rhodococcus sp. SGAir0479 TaxID=2567884 RepID=UPI0010CCBBE0|nr:helix-turn-helix transcriptional regulator [Rhodococcus sp. SGAir0479]QCQ91760.1 XRE family transcriptional regulator [Rhodococcus sp. SGAir0479]